MHASNVKRQGVFRPEFLFAELTKELTSALFVKFISAKEISISQILDSVQMTTY
jgi:hypothetical protein